MGVLQAVVERAPQPHVFGQRHDIERQLVGKFGEHGFQFVGVFSVGGEFAVELLAADFAAGEDV